MSFPDAFSDVWLDMAGRFTVDDRRYRYTHTAYVCNMSRLGPPWLQQCISSKYSGTSLNQTHSTGDPLLSYKICLVEVLLFLALHHFLQVYRSMIFLPNIEVVRWHIRKFIKIWKIF